MKEKIKTTSFWLGVSGAVVIVLESLSNLFNINIDSGMVGDIVLSICSVLVLLGFVTKKNISDTEVLTKEELLMELKDVEEIEIKDEKE